MSLTEPSHQLLIELQRHELWGNMSIHVLPFFTTLEQVIKAPEQNQ